MAVTNLNQAGMAQSQTPDQRKDKQKGTGFTNINKVLDANQGNKLGEAVSGGLQQTGQNIQQSVDRAKERFGKSLEQGALGEQQAQERQDLLNKAQQGQEINEQDSGRFGRLSSGQYTGQAGLENAEGIQNKANQAEDLSRGVNTQTGRYGLLQQFVGSPKYTQGAMRTDSLLLGQAAPEVRQAASELKGATRGVDTATRAAQAQAAQAKAETEGFGKATQEMYDTSVSGINDPVLAAQKAAQERSPIAEQEFQALSANLPKLLAGGKNFAEYMGPQDLAKMGVGADEIKTMQKQLKVLKDSGMSTEQATNVLRSTMQQNLAGTDVLSNVGSFMNEGQAKSLNALAKLGGKAEQEYSGLGEYQGEDVALTDGSSVSGLADARNKQSKLSGQAKKLDHYVTNRDDAIKNGYLNVIQPKGGSAQDKAFFEQDPGLKKWFKEVQAGTRGTKGLEEAMSAYIDKTAAKSQSLKNKAGEYGSLNSIDSYKKYLSKLPGGGKVGVL